MAQAKSSRLSPAMSESLVQIAYDSIRASIIDGRFALGEHIVEQQLADELTTSRAPVREALRRLQQEGLVEMRPRRGIFVRKFTATDFVDIYNVRIAIERAAARLIVMKSPSLAGIEKTIDAMSRAASDRELDRVVDLELQIHQEICCASGNQYLASVFHSLAGPIRIALGLDNAAYERLDDVVEEHRPLLKSLSCATPEEAERSIHQHIVSTVGPVLVGLGGNPSLLFPVETGNL